MRIRNIPFALRALGVSTPKPPAARCALRGVSPLLKRFKYISLYVSAVFSSLLPAVSLASACPSPGKLAGDQCNFTLKDGTLLEIKSSADAYYLHKRTPSSSDGENEAEPLNVEYYDANKKTVATHEAALAKGEYRFNPSTGYLTLTRAVSAHVDEQALYQLEQYDLKLRKLTQVDYTSCPERKGCQAKNHIIFDASAKTH